MLESGTCLVGDQHTKSRTVTTEFWVSIQSVARFGQENIFQFVQHTQNVISSQAHVHEMYMISSISFTNSHVTGLLF